MVIEKIKRRGITVVRREGKCEDLPRRNQQGEEGTSPCVLLFSAFFTTVLTKLRQVLEYTLFQPGFFVDYLVPANEHLQTSRSQELWIDFFKRRAIVLDNDSSAFTVTTLNDLANVVVRAIEYEGEWPVIGGIQGTTLTTAKLLEIGTKVRGMY